MASVVFVVVADNKTPKENQKYRTYVHNSLTTKHLRLKPNKIQKKK